MCKSLQGGEEELTIFDNTYFLNGPYISCMLFMKVQVFKSCPYGFFVNIFKWDWFNGWSFLKWCCLPQILLENIILVYKTRTFQFFQNNNNLDYKLNTVTKTNDFNQKILIFLHFIFKGDTAGYMLWIIVGYCWIQWVILCSWYCNVFLFVINANLQSLLFQTLWKL